MQKSIKFIFFSIHFLNSFNILIYFSVNLCYHYFCNFQIEISKWTIFKHESDKNKKCLSVGNFENLSIVVDCLSVTRLQPTLVYVEAWNIYLKYRILSKTILTWPDFWFLRHFVWAGQKYCHMSDKNITKMNSICVW